jgi:surface polysaccharide O-acyltransferase-like enzyme
MQSETTNSSSSRYLWADFVRNIGILLVILGHVSGVVVQRFQDFSIENWNAANVYNIIARSCVPLLFMVSGALLLPRQESIRDFYSKRFKKVIFPFLFWSVLYLLVKEGWYASYTPLNALKVIVITLFSKPAEYHLWFMYELFAAYLFTPILRKLVDNGSETILWYFAAIWFIFGPLTRLVEFFVPVESIFQLGYVTGYIGYFILGYLLVRFPIRKWMVWTSAAVYLVMAVLTGWLTWYGSVYAGKLVDYFQYLLGMNIVFLAVAAYMLLRAAGEKIFSTPRPRLAKFAVGLTSASFGMYLIHVFILNYLRVTFKISPLDGPSIYMIPITTVITFLISWIIIFILQKIPYVRSLVA